MRSRPLSASGLRGYERMLGRLEIFLWENQTACPNRGGSFVDSLQAPWASLPTEI